jgi:RNA polymerase sigma-70 factor (ECF subfamily)
VNGARAESGSPESPSDGREAFTRIYQQTAAGVYACLRRLCGCPDLAEDLLQETFLAVFKGLPGFNGRSSPRTWVYAIAVNKFRDHCRNRWGRVEVDSEKLEAFSSQGPEPLEAVIREEERRRIYESVLALPPELRITLVLVRFEELTYSAAAEILGTTPGTVRMRIHRAHRALAEMLEETGHGKR